MVERLLLHGRFAIRLRDMAHRLIELPRDRLFGIRQKVDVAVRHRLSRVSEACRYRWCRHACDHCGSFDLGALRGSRFHVPMLTAISPPLNWVEVLRARLTRSGSIPSCRYRCVKTRVQKALGLRAHGTPYLFMED